MYLVISYICLKAKALCDYSIITFINILWLKYYKIHLYNYTVYNIIIETFTISYINKVLHYHSVY